MATADHFSAGDTVKLSTQCPIDFEGVGPTTHELGRVVAPADTGERSGCLAVRFERSSVPWLIPHKYLQHVNL